jgi:hypothetical protein
VPHGEPAPKRFALQAQVKRAMTIIFLGALLGAMALGVPIAFSLLPAAPR